MTTLTKRQKLILKTLAELAGRREASTRQIAEKLNLNVNGVSQSLGAMFEYVEHISDSGRGGETMWKLKGM